MKPTKSRRGERGILSVEVMMLQTLVSFGPSYGEELMREITRKTGGLVVVSVGAAYQAMKLLERRGHIEFDHTGDISKSGGRPPTCFRVTTIGTLAAQQQRSLILDLIT